jgi:CheY-like chemotaxis protein
MTGPTAKAEPAPHDPTVLLVDDNLMFLRVLAAVLEEGVPAFRTHGVTTGGAALAYLCDGVADSASPTLDFILLDFHLPDFDAPAVLQRLRRSSPCGNIPVLVLTQAHWAEDEAAALAAGATAFHAKPSSLAELRRVIVEFWRREVRRPPDISSTEVACSWQSPTIPLHFRHWRRMADGQ